MSCASLQVSGFPGAILYMGTYSSFMYWSVFPILVISWKEPWATQDRFGVAGASKDNLLGHSMFK